jgi:oligogalacturonide lyase
MAKGERQTIPAAAKAFDPMPRPRRASVAYRGPENSYWLAHLDGSRNFRLRLAAGLSLTARWAPDGRTLYYLSDPSEPGRSIQLREHDPDTGEDKLVAATSQFASFSANTDASVFAGASLSKAQPFVMILLRSVRRELTICEHRATDPASVSPVFTPDSQQIYFQSDREGKPALYSMNIERLVEKTEEEEESRGSDARP